MHGSVLFSFASPRGRTLSRAALPFVMALVGLALPAQADLAGDVASLVNKTKSIETKASAIVTSTKGIPALVKNVADVTAQFGTETIQDVMVALEDAKDMLEFLKARATSAGSVADHPDVENLVANLEGFLDALLKDTGADVDLGLITDLLAILPDPVLAVLGQAVSTAGVNDEFVLRIGVLAEGLPLLQEALELAGAPSLKARSARMSSQASLNGGSDELCEFTNANRELLGILTYELLVAGGAFRVEGGIMQALSRTVQTTNYVGAHGYAGMQIKSDPLSALGKIYDAMGETSLNMSQSGTQILRHCELFWYQQEILATQQAQLDLQEVQLEVVCRANKNKGKACKKFKKK